jgi:hypothetical protein
MSLSLSLFSGDFDWMLNCEPLLDLAIRKSTAGWLSRILSILKSVLQKGHLGVFLMAMRHCLHTE